MIALALHYMSSTCDSTDLQVMFGILSSTLPRDFTIGLVTLLETLRTGVSGLGRIILATADEQRVAAEYLNKSRPFPAGLLIWSFCDGTVFRVMKAPDLVLEQLLYSGFHKLLCSSCILIVLPNDVITHTIMDLAGKTHDSTGVGPLVRRRRVQGALAPGHRIAGDGVFVADRLSDIFVAPIGENERIDRMSADEIAWRRLG